MERSPTGRSKLSRPAISQVTQSVKRNFLRHPKATLIATATLPLLVISFLLLMRPSDCLDLETHFIGRIRVRCAPSETSMPEALADGLSGKQYIDRKAGFALRVEQPANWSIVKAHGSLDVNGRPVKAFQFPSGILGDREVTLLTHDGVVAFIHNALINEGKANFWVYTITDQTSPVEEFVSGETKNLLRTGSALVALMSPLAVADSQSRWRLRSTTDGVGRVELAKLKASPDHRQALLLWRSPLFGISADIVGRVIVGERHTYYALAVRVAPAGPVEEEINDELRKMIESFEVLRFENLRRRGRS